MCGAARRYSQLFHLVQHWIALVMSLHEVTRQGLGGVDKREETKTIPAKFSLMNQRLAK